MSFPTPMIYLVIIIFMISPISSTKECHKFEDSVHNQILQWWKKVTVQKPLKCAMNHEYSKPYPENIFSTFFQSILRFLGILLPLFAMLINMELVIW